MNTLFGNPYGETLFRGQTRAKHVKQSFALVGSQTEFGNQMNQMKTHSSSLHSRFRLPWRCLGKTCRPCG